MKKRYLENRFLPDENLVARAEYHWMFYMPTVEAVVFLIVSGVCSVILLLHPELLDNDDKWTLIVAICLLVFFISLKNSITGIIKVIRYRFGSDFVLTNRRLVMKNGLLNVRVTEIVLSKVEGISITETMLGRLMGFGTLHITTGGAEQIYPRIRDVVAFHNAILEQMQRYRSEAAMKAAALSSSTTVNSVMRMLQAQANGRVTSLPHNNG